MGFDSPGPPEEGIPAVLSIVATGLSKPNKCRGIREFRAKNSFDNNYQA